MEHSSDTFTREDAEERIELGWGSNTGTKTLNKLDFGHVV